MVGVYGPGLTGLHRQATHDDFCDGFCFPPPSLNWKMYLYCRVIHFNEYRRNINLMKSQGSFLVQSETFGEHCTV